MYYDLTLTPKPIIVLKSIFKAFSERMYDLEEFKFVVLSKASRLLSNTVITEWPFTFCNNLNGDRIKTYSKTSLPSAEVNPLIRMFESYALTLIAWGLRCRSTTTRSSSSAILKRFSNPSSSSIDTLAIPFWKKLIFIISFSAAISVEILAFKFILSELSLIL